MAECCTPRGYRRMFSERSAAAQARRYRRQGLDGTSRRIADLLRRRGISGQTLLEVGGGIGALQVDLVKAGAARATSVELTPTYEAVATELLAEAGLGGAVERRVGDFVAQAGDVPAADVVVLNRVVCCYPDMPRLTGAAADHARRLLVLSFPEDRWWVRAGLAAGNLLLWLTRAQFQVFVHEPGEIFAVCARAGLQPAEDQRGVLWRVVALERSAAA